MEILAAILLGAIAALSPTGAIGEARAEQALRQRLGDPEVLVVRLESRPVHQFLLNGRLDRLQVAGRGLYPLPALRLEALEVETDPLSLDLGQLRGGAPRQALRQPLQAAWRTTFIEADLNRALGDPRVLQRLQPLAESLRQRLPGTRGQRYRVLAAAVDLQPENRIALAVEVRVSRAAAPEEFRDFKLQLTAAVGLEGGRRLALRDTAITVDGRAISGRYAGVLAERLSDRLDLNRLGDRAIAARLLQLEVCDNRLQIVGFVRLLPWVQAEQIPPENATL